jgi:hypothetical protein
MTRPTRSVRVEVGRAPDPFLLRPAIEARLAGRPLLPGPERTIADAVAVAVERAKRGEPWR